MSNLPNKKDYKLENDRYYIYALQALKQLISACLIPDIPNLVEERERIIKLAEQSGIGFSVSKNSRCKKCGGDTRIRYWKLDGNIFKPS